MDLDVRRALLLRSTNYKDLDTVLAEQLAVVAEQHGLTAKGLAAAFDKFMTVSRWGGGSKEGRGRATEKRCRRQ